jgi:hypothetical protein
MDKPLKVGDIVHYHAIIGGPITSTWHKILTLQMELDSRRNAAWITGKSGCVAVTALSLAPKPIYATGAGLQHELRLMNALLLGYLVCALWTEDDKAPSGEYGQSGRPEELLPKIAPGSVTQAVEECFVFFRANADKLRKFHGTDIGLSEDQWLTTKNAENCGHDFWLSRNGHGSGFFDRYSEPDPRAAIGDQLQDEAGKAGSRNVVFEDDGTIIIE